MRAIRRRGSVENRERWSGSEGLVDEFDVVEQEGTYLLIEECGSERRVVRSINQRPIVEMLRLDRDDSVSVAHGTIQAHRSPRGSEKP